MQRSLCKGFVASCAAACPTGARTPRRSRRSLVARAQPGTFQDHCFHDLLQANPQVDHDSDHGNSDLDARDPTVLDDPSGSRHHAGRTAGRRADGRHAV